MRDKEIACHAEGRGFESLQPLPGSPRASPVPAPFSSLRTPSWEAFLGRWTVGGQTPRPESSAKASSSVHAGKSASWKAAVTPPAARFRSGSAMSAESSCRARRRPRFRPPGVLTPIKQSWREALQGWAVLAARTTGASWARVRRRLRSGLLRCLRPQRWRGVRLLEPTCLIQLAWATDVSLRPIPAWRRWFPSSSSRAATIWAASHTSARSPSTRRKTELSPLSLSCDAGLSPDVRGSRGERGQTADLVRGGLGPVGAGGAWQPGAE